MKRYRWLVLVPAFLVGACKGILGLTDPELASPDASAPPDTQDDGSAHTPDAPHVDCSTDVSTSARNCGQCGHDCGRGACRDGACQPFVLAKVAGSVYRLATDEKHVYVTYLSAPIVRIAKATGNATPLSASTSNAKALAHDGYYLYWATLWSETDGFASLSRASCTADHDGTCGLRDELALVGSSLYGTVSSIVPANGFGGTAPIAWIDLGRGNIATPGASSTSSKELAKAETGERGSIRIVGETLYWSENGTSKIGRLKKGDTNPQRFDIAPYFVTDFVVVGQTILFATYGGSETLRRGTFGTTAVEGIEEIGKLDRPQELLLDGPEAFVLSADGLRSCPANDCRSMTTLVSFPKPDAGDGLVGLAADDTTIWFGSEDGTIYGLAR